VYNAVLCEYLARSRAVKSDPAWAIARGLPRRTTAERKARRAAFAAVEQIPGFSLEAAQSFASALRKSFVREHLPAQETQNLGARAYDAVKRWHLGNKGKPRFKPAARGLRLLASRDGIGALRPKTDAEGRLDGLQWGAGFVIPITEPAQSRRRGTEQQAELADQISLNNALLRRAQRHLDRQHRAGSPGCFHPNGTHTPGRCELKRSNDAKQTALRVAELHRRFAQHRKTLHGGLANRLFGHGADIACEKLDYVAWQKNFPRSVRDRAPGFLVQTIRRKAESAGGDRLYEYNPKATALSQTCLCGNRMKKPLSQRVHRCECGIREHRDLFSAYLGLHVRAGGDGLDRLSLEAANRSWLHRQDIDGSPRPGRTATLNRRGHRHPPTRRSVARINARRRAKAAMRQSRSARTSAPNRPTALPK
jgi:hypothetical protein